MQKPDDIPEDIWAAAVAAEREANEAYRDGIADPFVTVDQLEATGVLIIARAILAEREALEGSIRGLQEERRRMAIDWCDFCVAIGVDVDTHEAVAAELHSRLSELQ